MFIAPKRSRLSDDIAQQLIAYVEEQQLQPGSRLPSERELTSRFKVGRTSIREGLRRLEILNLVEVIPGKGTFLKEGVGAPVEKLLRLWMENNRGALKELIELREALETQAAFYAAQRRSESQLQAMDREIASMRLATDAVAVDDFVNSDTAFHNTIAIASQNSLLQKTLASISEETFSYRVATASLGVEALERSLADHQTIFDSIRDRNAEGAREAMRSHIIRFPQVFRILSVEQPQP